MLLRYAEILRLNGSCSTVYIYGDQNNWVRMIVSLNAISDQKVKIC